MPVMWPIVGISVDSKLHWFLCSRPVWAIFLLSCHTEKLSQVLCSRSGWAIFLLPYHADQKATSPVKPNTQAIFHFLSHRHLSHHLFVSPLAAARAIYESSLSWGVRADPQGRVSETWMAFALSTGRQDLSRLSANYLPDLYLYRCTLTNNFGLAN